MPGQLREFIFYNTHNFVGAGPGGQGVEPPVRKKLGQALGMSGIKVRLG